MPVFFMLLFGIFTYSMILFGRGNAICAANVAARYASMHSSTSLVPSTLANIKGYATPYLYGVASPASDVSVTYNPANTNVVGATVKVTVSVTYPTGIPFYGGGSVTITGTAQRTISR